MRVAQVAPMAVETTIAALALRGSGVRHRFEEWGAVCLFRKLCDTPALPGGTDCRIVAVEGLVACKAGATCGSRRSASGHHPADLTTAS